MPGLFGVVDSAAARSELHQRELLAIAQRMSDAMRYEPEQSAMVLSFPILGAHVGRVGFSQPGPQATRVEPAAVMALTTGETFAAERPSDALLDAVLGPQASEAARAYKRSGEEGLTTLAGICAGFVVDAENGKCFLFNDRYGRERIFVHVAGTRVLFASEAKAILAVAPDARAFDSSGLAELLACGCTLGTRSLFENVEVLEGGTLVAFDRTGVKRRRYFDRSQLEQLTPVSANEFLEGFAESLRTVVNATCRTRPKVGISLTGGLDSRMIMASVDVPRGMLPSYTFGSMFRTTGDVSVGSQVAARCGQPHQVIELGNEFLRTAPEVFEQAVYVSDGYLGLSGAAELYLNRRARSIAPARMTGNWGGELMRGVRAFKYAVPHETFVSPELTRRMQESAATFSTTSANPLSAALFQQLPFQGYGRYAIERSQMTMRSPFLADDVVRWLYRAPAAVRESQAAIAVIARRPDLLALPTDLGLLGTGPRFLRRTFRRVVIKAEYMTSHGAPDWLAQLSSRLPASILETRFLGVDKFHHFRYWMRHELAGYVRRTLVQEADTDLRHWFDMKKVAQMVEDHISGRANHTDAIDKLLTVTIAKRTLFKAAEAQIAPEPHAVVS